MSEAERKDFIESYSVESKEMVYMKSLSKEELDIKRDELAQSATQKSILEDELREIKKEHKAQIDPLNKLFSERLKEIKTQSIEMSGMAHKVPDYDNQAIHFIAADGTVRNSLAMLERKVNDIDLVKEFTLSIPIFKGYEKKDFTVFIGLDPKSSQVDFFLYSDELFFLTRTEREKLFSAELERIKNLNFNCSIIYVS